MEPAGRLLLPHEPLAVGERGQAVAHQLDGDAAIDDRIAREKEDTHSAGADGPLI